MSTEREIAIPASLCDLPISSQLHGNPCIDPESAMLKRKASKVPSERIALATKPRLVATLSIASSEKRSKPRRQCYIECVIKSPLGHHNRALIVDMSETGLKLKMQSRSRLPERVQIVSQRINLDIDAEVMWQGLDSAGLRFVAPQGRSKTSRSRTFKANNSGGAE